MSFACRRPAGEGGVVNPLPIPDLTDTVVDPADASCSVVFGSDGTASRDGFGAPTNFNWYGSAPITGIGNTHWIRLTVNSGTAPNSGDSTAAWLQMNATRQWGLARTTIGTNTGNYTIQIATDSGGANIVSTVTFNMTSTVDT